LYVVGVTEAQSVVHVIKMQFNTQNEEWMRIITRKILPKSFVQIMFNITYDEFI
jgi:hypothetical protein